MPSFRIEHRLGIAVPAPVVWQVVSDLERWAEWNPLYIKAEGVLRIGTQLTLTQALDLLAARAGIDVVAVSSFRETDPVGYLDQPRFLNAAAAIDTSLTPTQLLDVLLGVERELGRVRTDERYGPRTIDLGLQWGKVGFQLCYEIIFSGHVVDERNRPAFIFNPSNDAWFGRWGPP